MLPLYSLFALVVYLFQQVVASNFEIHQVAFAVVVTVHLSSSEMVYYSWSSHSIHPWLLALVMEHYPFIAATTSYYFATATAASFIAAVIAFVDFPRTVVEASTTIVAFAAIATSAAMVAAFVAADLRNYCCSFDFGLPCCSADSFAARID